MKKHLILSADDYGLSKGVNEAVLEAVKAGLVSSVQVLMNYSSEQDILNLQKAISESGRDCGIGFHLNTTTGPSFLQKESELCCWNQERKQYEFYPITKFVHNRPNLQDAKEELKAQFEALADIVGADKIDSLSSHHGIHLFSRKFFGIFKQYGEKYKIPSRSPLMWRMKQHPKTRNYPFGKLVMPLVADGIKTFLKCEDPSTKKELSRAKDRKFLSSRRKKLRQAGSPTPVNTAGHWYGQPKLKALSWTVEQLKKMPRGHYSTEIFVHLSNTENWKGPELTYELKKRQKEFQALCDPETAAYIHSLWENSEVELSSFRKALTK